MNVSLLIAVWALVCEIILLLQPRETYSQGAISGIVIALTAALVVWQAHIQYKENKEEKI
jgi:hypothetical protein